MTEASYQGYREWKAWKACDFGRFSPDEAATFAEELRRCGIGSLQGRRVLEVGFGNGGFASWARGEGAEVFGTELLPELQELGGKAGLRVIDAAAPLAGQVGAGTMDLVVALDVFEHLGIDRLQALLPDLRDCLRPDGCLLGRVPSGDSPFSNAIQHGDLTHRSVLGSSAIHQLAVAAGFVDVETREPALPLRGAGCLGAVRRLLVRAGRRIAFPLIARVFMGGGHPILSPNMVFVLRRS
ncbi:MAG: class I SAM-dependent methyltransferase [Planctomycetia bacterium]|nr:class I SAM-dependent methyltransferase [Planctomycetia bacterium]